MCVCVCVCVCVRASVCLSVRLSICLSVCLSVSLSLCLFVFLFISLYVVSAHFPQRMEDSLAMDVILKDDEQGKGNLEGGSGDGKEK